MLTNIPKFMIMQDMKIKEYMDSKKFNYRQMAEHVGLYPQAIHKYATTDTLPRRKTAKKIVRKTGGEITLADIYGVN